jgi:hypothetical protein
LDNNNLGKLIALTEILLCFRFFLIESQTKRPANSRICRLLTSFDSFSAEREGLFSMIPMGMSSKQVMHVRFAHSAFVFPAFMQAGLQHSENKNAPHLRGHYLICGERGIRTPGPFGSTVFKTAAFDRSAISPRQK